METSARLFVDHNGEAARVVRDRRPDIAPIAALHRHFRTGLAASSRSPASTITPKWWRFIGLVFTTPSLAGRLTQYMLDDEDALAAVLAPGVGARLQAAQVIAVQRVPARTNWPKIADGRTAHDVQPEAVADADQARWSPPARSLILGPAFPGL